MQPGLRRPERPLAGRRRQPTRPAAATRVSTRAATSSASTTPRSTPTWPTRSRIRTRSPPIAAPGSGPWSTALVSIAANGDAFSARCTSQFNCSSVENVHYRAVNDPNRGYWYVVQVPAGVSGDIDINVFDASYNHDTATKIMDGHRGAPARPTSRRSSRSTSRPTRSTSTCERTSSPRGAAATTPTDGGCWWKLRKEAGFFRSWNKLCTITGAQARRHLPRQRPHQHRRRRQRGRQQRLRHRGRHQRDRYANPGRASTPTPTCASTTRTSAPPAPATARSTWPRSAPSSPAGPGHRDVRRR